LRSDFLTDEQIARTLERHRLPAKTPIKGVLYQGTRVLVVIEGARLVVPADVLEMPRPRRKRALRWAGRLG
jgi:hypothetical protein